MLTSLRNIGVIGGVIALALVSERDADAAHSSKVLVFEGTVSSIKVVQDEFTPWLVTLIVEHVVSGEFSGGTFSFAVHSPARSGLEVGGSYTVKAVWKDGRYYVDPFQWRLPKRTSAHSASVTPSNITVLES